MIWIGLADAAINAVFDYVHEIVDETIERGSTIQKFLEEQRQERATSGPSSRANKLTPADKMRHKGLRELLQRPWFKRVWVIQEVAKARSAQVLCGTNSISAPNFAMIPQLIEVTPDPHCQAILDIMPGFTRKFSWWKETRDLHTLLLKFKGSEASEPRDSIYALLGISSNASETEILLPDYEKTIEKVIQDAIIFILRLNPEQCGDYLPHWTMPEFQRNLVVLGDAVFSWAIENGYKSLAKLVFYTNKIQGNFPDDYGRKPLSLAAQRGYDDMVELLLSMSNGDINLSDRSGQTPLLLAAEKGHEAVVKLLLKNKELNMAYRDTRAWSPLYKAALNGHAEVARLILTGMKEKGPKSVFTADVLETYEVLANLFLQAGEAEPELRGQFIQTPLWWAAGHKHGQLFETLLKVSNIGEKDESLLSWALDEERIAVVKMLLKTGKFDVNKILPSPGKKSWYRLSTLEVAALKGYDELIQFIFDMDGVDLNPTTEDGCTPLARAAGTGNESLVNLLLETGRVDVEAKDEAGKTAVYRAASNGHGTIVSLLHNLGGANLNSADLDGKTPLWRAAFNGKSLIVNILLKTGKVLVDCKDNEFDQTPLSCATEFGYQTVVRLLLETGQADPEATDRNQRTPLSLTAVRGYSYIASMLLETGRVDIESKDNRGRTPLWYAARYGHEALVQELLLKSVQDADRFGKLDIDSKDRDGESPVSVAAKWGHKTIAERLEAYRRGVL